MSKIDEKARELEETLTEIELSVTGNYTLADAIREGSTVTEHSQCGWGDGASACALTAAVVAGRARDLV